jgi:GNAT superfamily N-acetyltransferase
MDVYTVREAKPEEQRELTRLCVRATMQAGYDEAFIDRSMPSLTVALPMITANCVQVAQDGSSEVVGVVWVVPTALQGIAALHGLYVDPPRWKRGIGRVLFGAAVTHAKGIKAGAIIIYAEPSAEGFINGWEPSGSAKDRVASRPKSYCCTSSLARSDVQHEPISRLPIGTFETCRSGPMMSVDRGRPEMAFRCCQDRF